MADALPVLIDDRSTVLQQILVRMVENWRPQRDLNPRYRRERAMS